MARLAANHENTKDENTINTEPTESRTPWRPQFSVRAMLGLTAGYAVLFAVIRWLGVSPANSVLLTGIVTLSVLAAAALVAAIAASIPPEPPDAPQ